MRWQTKNGRLINDLIAKGKDALLFTNDWTNNNYKFKELQKMLKDTDYELFDKYFSIETRQNMYEPTKNGLDLYTGA